MKKYYQTYLKNTFDSSKQQVTINFSLLGVNYDLVLQTISRITPDKLVVANLKNNTTNTQIFSGLTCTLNTNMARNFRLPFQFVFYSPDTVQGNDKFNLEGLKEGTIKLYFIQE